MQDDARRLKLKWVQRGIDKDQYIDDPEADDDFDPTGYRCERYGGENLCCADCGEPVQKMDVDGNNDVED